MSTRTASKPAASNRTSTAINDLAPKSTQTVRGGREAGVPSVSEIVVTKTTDCSSV